MADSSSAFGIIAAIVIPILIAAILIGVMTKVLDDDESNVLRDLAGVTGNATKVAVSNFTNSTLPNTLQVGCTSIISSNGGKEIYQNTTMTVNDSSSAFGVAKCYSNGLVQVMLKGNATNSTGNLFVTYTASKREASLNASENVRQGFITGAENTTTYFSLGILAVVLALLGGMFLRGRFGDGDGEGGGIGKVNLGSFTGGFEK